MSEEDSKSAGSEAGAETKAERPILDEKEALKFATDTEWAMWVKDEKVRKLLTDIRDTTIQITRADMSSGGKGSGNTDALANLRDEGVKCVVVGDGGVGKTCLLTVYIKGSFNDDYVPTVFENTTVMKEYKGSEVPLRLFDTAGQEEYDRLRPLSYPKTHIVLLCYSAASRTSFEAITEKWAPEIHHYLPGIPTILVALKRDLREHPPETKPEDFDPVPTSDGKTLAEQLESEAFFEVSAKENQGVTEVFDKLVKIVFEDVEEGEEKGEGSSSKDADSSADPSDTDSKKKKKKKKGGCVLL